MSYDDSEKLKDEVGILVGLLNSLDDSIVKLAKIQLIQLGKNAVPSLRAVLNDMYLVKSEYQKNANKFSRIYSFERYTKFSSSIVNGVLEVLSYFADNTLITTFLDWLPSHDSLIRSFSDWETSQAAVEALIKIGSESAFTAATSALNSLFSWKSLDDSGYSEWTDKEKAQFALAKDDIITDIINFVDKDVVSKFITSYPDIDSGLKELVTSLIIKNKAINYSDKILEWMDNGSAEDDKRLSKVVMDFGININRELSKKLFLRLTSHHYKDTESFLKYLLKNLEIDDMVEIELYLYLKSPPEPDSDVLRMQSYIHYGRDEYDYYPKPGDLSNFIILKLQARREDAKSYITKVLAERNKDRVKAASWLLNYVNETHQERDQRL